MTKQRTFECFGEGGDPCPVCQTWAQTTTILVPIPGTQKGNICEARRVHLECYKLAQKMAGIEDKVRP